MQIGVYIHDGFTFEPREECPYYWGLPEYRRYLDWLAGAGVEIVEACQQLGWMRYPALAEEIDRLRSRQALVGEAHARGMQYYQILGSNLYSQLPWDRLPPGQLEIAEKDCVLCPQEGDGFTRTAELGRYFARVFRGADGFEVFAGDWGGCPCGRCGIDQYRRYVNYHAAHLAEEQPAARVWANVWSISSWQGRTGYPGQATGGWRKVWDDEIGFSKRFLDDLDQVPAEVGVAFPLHHWYRGYTQQFYRQDELPFWPDVPALEKLHAAGRRLLAWTHFIVEDDPYHGRLWGTLSVRLRYIKRLAGLLNAAPFETVMGNVYSARQGLNLHGLVRFIRQPDLDVETVIGEFVQAVAEPSGQQLLRDMLVYLENRDPWHFDLPEYARLPALAEAGLPGEAALRAELPGLARHIRPDAALLLNGPEHFARSVAAAFALHGG